MPRTTAAFRAVWRLAAMVTLLILLPFACARVSPVRKTPSVEAACERFFEELDRITEEAGVGDGGVSRVDGAAYLRADRFLASFSAADLSAEGYTEWLERLRRLDAERRAGEIANLRIDGISHGLYSPFPALSTVEVVRECGRRLVERDLRSIERKNWLARHVVVPDAYRSWQRMLGLYPVTRLMFAEAVAVLHRELRETFALPPEKLPRRGELVRYVPGPPNPLTDDQATDLLQASRRNALNIPAPEPKDLDRLSDAFAPVWEVDTAKRSDRVGSLHWGWRDSPEVDVDAPAVYRFHSYARFRHAQLLQLNYVIWFPERSPSGSFDLYSGRLDGVIWRVTLSPEGRALAYDTIHLCGCYYLIFPGLGYRVVQPDDGSEPVLSPYPLLPPKTGQRLVIRLSAGKHFLQAAYARSERGSGIAYRWLDAGELRSLPDRGGRRRSAFDPDGMVAGTNRLERFLLWPSGIASPGAMRQPGTHAIAMLGRRHFDDAGLLEGLLRPLGAAK